MNKRKVLIIIIFSLLNIACSNQNNDKIDLYKNEKRISQNLLDKKGHLISQILYNEDGVIENIIQFNYKENSLHNIKLKNNSPGLDSKWYDFYFKDIEYKNRFLIQKKIMIQYPFINSSEVSDIANIFSVIERFDERVVDGHKIISIKNFNQNIRFYPSEIEQYIPQNSIITDYEIILDNNNNVFGETYNFKEGKLTRKYEYKEGVLMKILCDVVYVTKETFHSVKEFRR
ncbi:hypothetical protein [Flavobacterium cerinum]|uniref:Lipoprotein n=1 Tax=Flavobacterium cerinum TaxID=2502784 RepID=A0ABY5IPX7_9FLAO|nr:hypothetical protein [Flavobacterium cerinum]UUC44814.1 hypothetical protein NOX80_14405 [Flavobacterium cerinum]